MSEINTRKRGKYWEYRFEGAKINGDRKQITKGGFSTKKEALTAGTKALTEYNNAGLHFVPSEISVNDYLDYWMDIYCRINLKPVTVKNYEKKIRLYIKPCLGKYKLKSLSASIMQSLLNDMFNDGFSRNTLAVVKGILSGSLSYAVEPLKYIQNSPMMYVKMPSSRAKAEKTTRTEPHVYIPSDRINQIFSRFPEQTSTHIPMMLAYKGGLRCGEAFAVDWSSLDFDANLLNINKQIQWDEDLKVWYLSDPKYESFREIKLDQELMDLLKRERERQERARQYYAEHYTVYYEDEKRLLNTAANGKQIDFVAVRENGTLITPRTMLHTSSVIHHKMEYPEFDFHSLRYTHATNLAEENAPPKYVQKRLGHKNILVTMQIYEQLSEKLKEQG
ncbi:MAG: tyrosine-type recombinase/integrase [Oscillospiraceae bacterium]